jgi:hypothetical protein
MKHTWTKQPDQKIAGITHLVWVCKRCGAEKTQGNYKFSEPDYHRNGQIYSHYVECIDYELENSKTID